MLFIIGFQDTLTVSLYHTANVVESQPVDVTDRILNNTSQRWVRSVEVYKDNRAFAKSTSVV